MNLSRRGFLGALAAAGAVTALGPAAQAVEFASGRFVLEGKVITLDEPLVLEGLENFLIKDCVFITSDKFPNGKPAIIMSNCNNGVITRCHIDTSASEQVDGIRFKAETTRQEPKG